MLYSKNYNELGSYFREARLRRGLSQRDVADKLGYTPQFIYAFEKRGSSIPMTAVVGMIKLYKINPQAVIRLILKLEREFLENHFTK